MVAILKIYTHIFRNKMMMPSSAELTNLFIRHKRGVTLTRAGKKILSQIKPLLQCWQNAKLEALASHHQVQGHIRIGCHSTIGLFMHGILAELLEKYSKLEIELHHAPSENVIQQVIDLNIDIGIVTNPIQYPDLIMRKIAETETTFWVGSGKCNIQNIYSEEAVLICHADLRHTQLMFQQCKIVNLKFKRILNVNSIEVIANLTANGCGIGLLPSSFIKCLYAGKLNRVPQMPVITDELYLIYRNEHLNVEAIRTIISTIETWVKKSL